jgi:hypothetical protein
MRGMRRYQTTKKACQQFVSIELRIRSRGDLAEPRMLFDRANPLQKMIDLIGESAAGLRVSEAAVWFVVLVRRESTPTGRRTKRVKKDRKAGSAAASPPQAPSISSIAAQGLASWRSRPCNARGR